MILSALNYEIQFITRGSTWILVKIHTGHLLWEVKIQNKNIALQCVHNKCGEF